MSCQVWGYRGGSWLHLPRNALTALFNVTLDGGLGDGRLVVADSLKLDFTARPGKRFFKTGFDLFEGAAHGVCSNMVRTTAYGSVLPYIAFAHSLIVFSRMEDARASAAKELSRQKSRLFCISKRYPCSLLSAASAASRRTVKS